MANVASDRNTKIRAGNDFFQHLPVAAGIKLFAGGIAGVNAAGYLAPASGAGIKIPCVVERYVDNVGGAAGDKLARVRRCVAGLDIGAGITQAVVGSMVYFSDDHTVKAADTNASPAGILLELSEGQAWVDLNTAAPGSYPIPPEASEG